MRVRYCRPCHPDRRLLSDEIYGKLVAKGIEVLYDDREDISPGFKFKDADLIGVPLQVIISEKNTKAGEVEIKFRRTSERSRMKIADIENSIPNMLKKL